MHYSDEPSMVRVDFWKASPAGRFKWSHTAAVKWTGGYDGDLFRAFAESLRRHLWDEEKQSLRCGGLRATCLEPYHLTAHPLSILVDDIPQLLVNAGAPVEQRATEH